MARVCNDKENPNLGNARPEDLTGLTTGMTPVPKAPFKLGQIRNGSKRKIPPKRDKGDEYRPSEKQVDKEQTIDGEQIPNMKSGSRPLGSCLPKSKIMPSLIIRSEGLASHIEYMKDHALIAKFIGYWPIKKDLIWWINYHWKPKGGYELRLGAKGFFTVVFYNVEDKNKIFEGGPYFYNSVGLYLTFWKERFNPDKEDLSIAVVWLRLHSLPCEF